MSEHVCQFCGESFDWSTSLAVHLLNKHNEPPATACNGCIAALNEIERLQAEIERLKQPAKWVKCSERMPTQQDEDSEGHVWAWVACGSPVIKTSRAAYKFWTHWQPTGLRRPEPPKE